jgi:glycine cleavage system H lipoate-binding protein
MDPARGGRPGDGRHFRPCGRGPHRSGVHATPGDRPAGEAFGEIESVKAVSDLYAPVSGEVVEVNAALPDALDTLGSDPYGAGWIARIRPDDPAEMAGLLDRAAYDSLVAGGGQH